MKNLIRALKLFVEVLKNSLKLRMVSTLIIILSVGR